MVDVDDAIVKQCVEPKAMVPRGGTIALVTEHEMCFNFLYGICLKHFSL
jgi:hypothetical protein